MSERSAILASARGQVNDYSRFSAEFRPRYYIRLLDSPGGGF